MKKIMISLCMIAILFCTSLTVFADTAPTLTVGQVEAKTGESVQLPITLSGNTGILGAEFNISFDEALELTSVTQGSGLSGLTMTKPGKLTDNPIGVVFDNTEAVATNGDIVILTFTAPDKTGTYEVNVSYEEGNVIDGDLNPVEFNIVNGYINVSGEEVTEIASGWSGYTQWTLTSDGTLTFYGEGNMKNYGYNNNQPWFKYNNQITSVVIEEGVTAVGTGAFMNMTALESVTFPKTGLKTIGEAAFHGCTALKAIDLPDTVYTVHHYTFKNCTDLEKVRLSKVLIKVGQGAFENCTSLTYIYIPGDTEIIDSWSFKGCTALIEVDMTYANATEIREGAFKNCSVLTTVHFPASMTTFGDSAFYGIGATTFTIPATVTKIGPWCFARAALKEVIFEGNAPTFGEGAFNKITLSAYYPDGNSTWTKAVMQNYGGTVTWKSNTEKVK